MISSIKVSAQYPAQIAEIQKAPDSLTVSSGLLRMIEGAGFRYYWAAKGLTEKDLVYSTCEDCRNIIETMQHIQSLSGVVKNTVMGQPVERINPSDNYNEICKATNKNWADAANYLINNEVDVSLLQIDFGNGTPLPIWNLYNGPLSDAIYHTGQIVSLRRSSGNPIHPKVNVLMGVLNK